jgi:hypothetical protein
MTPSMFIQRAATNTGNAGKHGNVSAKASAVRSASAIRSSC